MNSLKCTDRGSSVGTETSSTSTSTVNGASSDRSGVPIDRLLHKNFYNMFTSDHESLDCAILYNDSFFDPIVVDVGSFEDGSNSGRNDLDDSVPISRRGRSMSTNEDEKKTHSHAGQRRRALSVPPKAPEHGMFKGQNKQSRVARSARRSASPGHIINRRPSSDASKSYQNESTETQCVKFASAGSTRRKGKQIQPSCTLPVDAAKISSPENRKPVRRNLSSDDLHIHGVCAFTSESNKHKRAPYSRENGKELNRRHSLQPKSGFRISDTVVPVARNSTSLEYHDKVDIQKIEREPVSQSSVGHHNIPARSRNHSHTETIKAETSIQTSVTKPQSFDAVPTLTLIDAGDRWRAESGRVISHDTSPRRPSQLLKNQSFPVSPSRRPKTIKINTDILETKPTICMQPNIVPPLRRQRQVEHHHQRRRSNTIDASFQEPYHANSCNIDDRRGDIQQVPLFISFGPTKPSPPRNTHRNKSPKGDNVNGRQTIEYDASPPRTETSVDKTLTKRNFENVRFL